MICMYIYICIPVVIIMRLFFLSLLLQQNQNFKTLNILVCAQGGVRVAYTEQLLQFGDSEGVEPGAVDRWLAASGTLEFDPPDVNALREGNGVKGARGQEDTGDDDDGDDEGANGARYDCGLDGCHKTFKHNHFLATGGGGLPKGFGEGV